MRHLLRRSPSLFGRPDFSSHSFYSVVLFFPSFRVWYRTELHLLAPRRYQTRWLSSLGANGTPPTLRFDPLFDPSRPCPRLWLLSLYLATRPPYSTFNFAFTIRFSCIARLQSPYYIYVYTYICVYTSGRRWFSGGRLIIPRVSEKLAGKDSSDASDHILWYLSNSYWNPIWTSVDIWNEVRLRTEDHMGFYCEILSEISAWIFMLIAFFGHLNSSFNSREMNEFRIRYISMGSTNWSFYLNGDDFGNFSCIMRSANSSVYLCSVDEFVILLAWGGIILICIIPWGRWNRHSTRETMNS